MAKRKATPKRKAAPKGPVHQMPNGMMMAGAKHMMPGMPPKGMPPKGMPPKKKMPMKKGGKGR